MFAPFRQRLVLLLALAALGSYLLTWHGRTIGFSEGGLGPACERVFSILTPVFVGLAGLVVVMRMLANRRKLANGFSRAQVAAANAVFATLLGIAGFEAFARWKDPLPARQDGRADGLTGVNQADERLGWSGRPLFDKPTIYRIEDKNAEGKLRDLSVRLRNNSQGFRDIEQERDPAKPAVVFVGDSYAWGHCAEFEETAVFKLRPELPNAQVYNLACPAYSIDQIALAYEIHGRRLKPKVVVALFLYVPINMKSGPLGWGLQKPWFRLVDGQLELQAGLLEFGKDETQREQLVARAEASGIYDLNAALRYLFRDWGGSESWFLRRGIEAWDKVLDNFQGVPLPPPVIIAILQRLQKEVEADGGKLLIATGPERSLVRWERLDREDHKKVEASVGRPLPFAGPFAGPVRHLRNAGLDVLDLVECFMPEGEALYDRDLHPGIVGNERMVEPLRARIEELLAR